MHSRKNRNIVIKGVNLQTNPRFPDFKHKGTGESLWIECSSNPPWVKSQLPVLDYRRKVLEDWGKGRSDARFQGSFSSS